MNLITSTAFAELCGMHAGDGTIYRTKRGLVWELRGSLDEKAFYDTHVVPLIEHIGFSLQGNKRSGGKNGCYGVRCCDKKFIACLLEQGFPVGNKTVIVRAPQSILQSTVSIKAAFLRGAFSTDGTAYLAKINRGASRTYPMVEFACASELLRNDVKILLSELDLDCKTWTYKSKLGYKPMFFLRLAGKKKTQIFSERIGFVNPKHQRFVDKSRNV